MTTRKGPSKGGRILVNLPFGRDVSAKGKKAGKSKLVLLKSGIAKFLNFPAIKNLPTTQVKGKKKIRTVGSYRQRSITLIFDKPQRVGGESYKTINVPLGTGCTVTDAVMYFKSQATSLNCVGVRTHNGKTYMWGEVA